MKQAHLNFLMVLLVVSGVIIASTSGKKPDYRPIESTSILEDSQPFEVIMSVLTHPRCLNCHPSDDTPKQGDERRPHRFGMMRGEADHGFQATQCATCHQTENNVYSGVPGAPHWGLAPASMGWQNLSKAEIAKVLLDPVKNGNRSHDDLIEHMTKDRLVQWAWNPGVNADGKQRSVPPVSQEEFARALEQWFGDGAPIPSN